MSAPNQLQVLVEDAAIKKELKLNVLAVHLEDGYWEKAIAIGKEILDEFKDDKIALLQVGRAYYAARHFENAYDYYLEYYNAPPKNLEKCEEMKRVENRMTERLGRFHINSLLGVNAVYPLREIDRADYEGPIEIKEISGRGRGLVLTADVKEKTVLIISKATAVILQEGSTAMDQEILGTLQAQLVAKLTTLINKNPSLFGPQIFGLSSHLRSELGNKQIPNFGDPEFQLDPIGDMATLNNICSLNQLILWQNRNGWISHRGIGLFIMPSYLKQHPRSNVTFSFYNDVMVITSKWKLKAGTELIILYPQDVPLPTAQEHNYISRITDSNVAVYTINKIAK